MTRHKYELLSEDGYTSTIYCVTGTPLVCKVFPPGWAAETHFPIEVAAYRRFAAQPARPSSILQYHGVSTDHEAGILLELASNGSLSEYLWRHHQTKPPSSSLLYRWARQAGEALSFVHSCGVLHADIYCTNFLLDANLDLRLADFAGASIDGANSPSYYRLTHQLFDERRPDEAWMEITVRSEIFALGSALYMMVSGEDLWPELEQERDGKMIIQRLRQKKFPALAKLPILRDVITKCWNVAYDTMADVVRDIVAEERSRVALSSGLCPEAEKHDFKYPEPPKSTTEELEQDGGPDLLLQEPDNDKSADDVGILSRIAHVDGTARNPWENTSERMSLNLTSLLSFRH